MASNGQKNKLKFNENLNERSALRTAHVYVRITVHNCRTQYIVEQ